MADYRQNAIRSIREKVGSAFPAADLSGPPSAWFKASVRSDAGGIKTVKLGGVTVEGTAVRELFGLRSTNFTVTTADDSLTFHTIGYGHGVGLSQYGAKYMAENGADYRETAQNTSRPKVPMRKLSPSRSKKTEAHVLGFFEIAARFLFHAR